MGEDSSHAERSSNSSSNNPASPIMQQENMELLIPSFSPSSAPSSPTNTLTRLGLKSPTSPSPVSPTDRSQVSAITVVALLDKLVNMLEAVQENQRRMEQRQADLEGAVRGVQGDVTRLSKSHTGTSNSVGKLLERSRKVSGHMKEVRERMDKQAVQVKRLEANHTHLLKRNHFKVLIFQEDNEIPSSVFVKDSLKTAPPAASQPDDEAASQTAASLAGGDYAAATDRSREEGLHTISLTSDEDEDPTGLFLLREDDELLECEVAVAASSNAERSRAEKLKRSSLKKVDSLKKAFSRQSIEKKMSKIGTKIVPPERREKIKKSFTPNHPKSPTAKSSSFKVSPMTFNVKKVRGDGEPSSPGGEQSEGSPVHVEIPALGSPDGKLPLAELHSRDGLDGVGGGSVEEEEKEGEETAGPPHGAEAEPAINGEAGSTEFDPNAVERPAKLAFPEHDEDDEEEEDEDEEEAERETSAAAAAAVAPTAAPLPVAAPITVEQAS